MVGDDDKGGNSSVCGQCDGRFEECFWLDEYDWDASSDEHKLWRDEQELSDAVDFIVAEEDDLLKMEDGSLTIFALDRESRYNQ